MTKTLIASIALVVIIVALLGLYFGLSKKQNTGLVDCTREAKICPDGSSVGRTGPLCEFAACPNPLRAGEGDGVSRGVRCYEYHQVATTSAPYTVNETIKITTSGNTVTGTKTGDQAGPDMMNGYTGTLTGTITNNLLTSVFDYVIEGSNNKEQELYAVTDSQLIKHRYPLVEESGILVPDTTKTFSEMVYQQAMCK